MRVRLLLTLGFLPLVLTSSASAEQCSADCTHPTKACVCAIDPPAGRVAVTPIGDIQRRPLSLGQALEIGDEIVSGSSDSLVSVTCPGGSDLKLHGVFRALIMPGGSGQDCAFNLLAGSADILTEQPTELTSGATLMGSKRTLYGMRVSRNDEGSTVECVVFEGEAEVRNLKLGRTIPIGPGTRAAWRNGQLVQPATRISDEDIQSATRLYARADLARARAQGISIEQPERFQRALEERYAAVLTRPADAGARIELARLQTTGRIARPALYHLAKAEALTTAQPEQRAAIARTKVDAYKQLGRTEEAAVETEKLRKLQSSKLRGSEELAENPSRDPGRTTSPATGELVRSTTMAGRGKGLQVSATATPPIVDAARATRIVVTVTQGGEPVAGAKVTVTAGGGVFRGSKEPRAEGVTDAKGVFGTGWHCAPCTTAYSMKVTASLEGLPTATTALTVQIR